MCYFAKKKDRKQIYEPAARVTARCAVPECSRTCWGINQKLLEEHQSSSGWHRVDNATLCPEHVRFVWLVEKLVTRGIHGYKG